MAKTDWIRVDPSSGAKPSGKPRRRFFTDLYRAALGAGLTLLGLVGSVWTLGIGRFLYPNVVTEPSRRVKLGYPQDYPPGTVETRFKEQYGLWLVHGEYDGHGQIYALRTVCTHLGCITIWQETERKFKCPCHGSGFSMTGANLEGPAPRPLERYAIRVDDDGQLEVDRSRLFQEELGQWRDPDSFVAV